ncbi:MAG: hypothetical protein IPM64_02510 [Phycisphaerales bacterium]|nr:hypothetical protein [Phycisphaerales bacterium]
MDEETRLSIPSSPPPRHGRTADPREAGTGESPATDPPAPAAHVLVIEANRQYRPMFSTSETLSESDRAELHAAAGSWRDLKYRARDVRAVADRLKLGGVAIWYRQHGPIKAVPRNEEHGRELYRSSGAKPAPIPAPITVPFEPVPLEEEFPGLEDLLHSTAEPPGHGGEAAGEAPIRRPNFLRRWALRTWVGIFMLPLLINATVQIIIHKQRWVVLAVWLPILAIVILGAVVIAALWDRWMVVPGGVIVRRTMFGTVRLNLQLFTARDAVLVVYPHPHGWVARLQRPNGPARTRTVTDVELQVLLAAWQSPLPSPTAEQMRSLIGE